MAPHLITAPTLPRPACLSGTPVHIASFLSLLIVLFLAACGRQERTDEIDAARPHLTTSRRQVSADEISKLTGTHPTAGRWRTRGDSFDWPSIVSSERSRGGDMSARREKASTERREEADHDVLTVRRADGTVVGTVRTQTAIRWFSPAIEAGSPSRTSYILAETPRAQLETGHPPELLAGGGTPPAHAAAADLVPCEQLEGLPDATVHILILFSQRSADFVLSEKQRTITEEAELVVQDLNLSLAASSIPATFQLAAAVRVDVPKQPSFQETLRLLQLRDDPWLGRSAHELRVANRADIVVFIEDHRTSYSAQIEAQPDTAFAVVSVYGLDTLALTHEIGHLIGAQHALNQHRETSGFPYAAAACTPDLKCSVMATIDPGVARQSCWSNPVTTCAAAGTIGSPRENNRCVLLQRLEEMARFDELL